MCEFCHKHGEGKKWYLNSQLYAEDLLSDLGRRSYIRNFFTHPEHLNSSEAKLKTFKKAPAFVRAAVTPVMVNRQKKTHYGQVLPIEDIEEIFTFASSIIRLPCICRQATTGTEQRYCYGISLAPATDSRMLQLVREIDASYLNGPETGGLEVLGTQEALSSIRELETKGLCHSIWTFITPFIGGLCNCDRADCMAMRATVTHDFPVMFRSEYIARVDNDLCSGCRQCMRVCQFGAISYSIALNRAVIDPGKCFGCGICRSVCKNDAIALSARALEPAAALLW
ncbi:MAG: 4Fe-4S binding protein [Dehalococcoidaceae bacterium]|nr:4Fe-4S binding protein [Dehalococcoidaceae bacterium]